MRRALFFVIIFFVIVAGWRSHAFAQSIGISNLAVDNQEGRIKVRFGVELAATEAVEQALRRGQVLALRSRARLARKRDYIWDSAVVETESVSGLRLLDGGTYEIIHPGGRNENYRGRDLAVVMREAWGAMGLDLGAWDTLTRDNVYVLSLDISLLRQDISSWLKNALFFWNFDAVSPAEYKLEFSY